jgi:glycopeptide antibiotics resistance protein
VLSTLLVHLPWLAFSVLIGIVLLGPFAGAWLAGQPRTTSALLAISALGIAVLTLYPEGDPQPEVTCAVAVPYLSPTAVESIANIVLFMPVAVLAALRWRRPIVAILGASALSAIIEAVQAFVPLIGRACDTSDWITNTIGAVLGGVVAVAALAWHRYRAASTRTGRVID